MKIPGNSSPPPVDPKATRLNRAGSVAKSDGSGAAESAKPTSVTPDHAKTAADLARVQESTVSRLMRPDKPPLPPRDQQVRNLLAGAIAKPAAQLPDVLVEKVAHTAQQARSGDIEGAADSIVQEYRNLPSAEADALLRGTLREICGPRAEAGHVFSSYESLTSNEKLGNMEIQDLMARYNQAEQLAGSVFKKKDDADQSIIDKI